MFWIQYICLRTFPWILQVFLVYYLYSVYKTPQCQPHSFTARIEQKNTRFERFKLINSYYINQSGIYILQDRLAVAGSYILIAITFDALTVYVNDRNSIQQISGSSIVYWVIYSWCIVAEGDSWYIVAEWYSWCIVAEWYILYIVAEW